MEFNYVLLCRFVAKFLKFLVESMRGSQVSFNIGKVIHFISSEYPVSGNSAKSLSGRLRNMFFALEDLGYIRNIRRSRGKIFIIDRGSELYELIRSLTVEELTNFLLNIVSKSKDQVESRTQNYLRRFRETPHHPQHTRQL